MKLSTINKWLRRFNLVLVIEVDHPEEGEDRKPTRLWIEAFTGYLARTSLALPKES